MCVWMSAAVKRLILTWVRSHLVPITCITSSLSALKARRHQSRNNVLSGCRFVTAVLWLTSLLQGVSYLMLANNSNNNHHFNLRQPAPPVKNQRILLVQSFTVSARMPLRMAASAFRLGRRRWSSLVLSTLSLYLSVNENDDDSVG